MTTKEFELWLDGYLTGGGRDMTVIASKLATVKFPSAPGADKVVKFPTAPATPYIPFPDVPLQPIPNDWYPIMPQPWVDWPAAPFPGIRIWCGATDADAHVTLCPGPWGGGSGAR